MSDLEQIAALANNVLQSGNNQLRVEAENQLKLLRDSKPNELVVLFLALLESNQPKEVRVFAATNLRKNLSEFAGLSFKNIWPDLSPDTREHVKAKLFEILDKEQESVVRKQISDAIGEIAGSVLSENRDAWPKFIESVWKLFSQSSVAATVSGFNLLQSFLSYAPDVFAKHRNELYALFKNALIHSDCKIKSAGLKALGTHLQVLETKEAAIYEDLVIPIYEAAYYLLTQDNGNEEGLEIVGDIVEQQPKFLKKSWGQLNELMVNIIKIPGLDETVKRMATETLLSFAERYPAFYRQNKDRLNGLIEMIFLHMIQIENTVPEEWKNPPEGYNEDSEEKGDFETTQFGMDAIDRLIAAVGEQELLPLLSMTVEKMLASADWRYKYAAVMALSQVGEYIEEAANIKGIVGILLGLMGDANPMIRYACCHAIGQISDDMQPQFQEHYGKDVYQKLLVALKDPVNRVVSHSAAALTNFLEGMEYSDVEPTMDQLVAHLLLLTSNGISIVKESALSALASAAELAGSSFVKYYEATLPVLFRVFEVHTTKEYKQLKGQCIETLTMVASAVGKEVFAPVAPKLIQYLIQLQSSELEQVDPQKTYVLIGWQRLSLVLGKDLAVYLPMILPSLFKLVEAVISTHLALNSFDINKPDEAEELTKESINTYETEEAEVAISMLNVFIEEFKELYVPYAEQTSNILVPIIKNHSNEDIKRQACQCLPSLVLAVKMVDPQAACRMAKVFFGLLIEAAEKEFDTELITDEVDTLKDITEKLDMRFLTPAELSELSERIIKLLITSDERKKVNADMKKEEELEPEENELIDDQIKAEEESQVAISEFIGALFKTHKEMTIGLVEYILTSVLPKVFGVSDLMNKFGLFIIDDMVEYLGYELLQNRWADFLVPLLKYAVDKNVVTRQAACYGLGIYAQKTPPVNFKPFLEPSLKILIESASIAKGSEKAKQYGSCKDNAVAAIGKIVKAHGGLFDPKPILKLWLTMLPLRSDKPEGCGQHELLVDIMLNSPQLLLSNATEAENVGALSKVLSVYGDILDTKTCNAAIRDKIKTHLNSLKTNELFTKNYSALWEGLSEAQRKQLTDAIK